MIARNKNKFLILLFSHEIQFFIILKLLWTRRREITINLIFKIKNIYD